MNRSNATFSVIFRASGLSKSTCLYKMSQNQFQKELNIMYLKF
jgi:hypothetical protein